MQSTASLVVLVATPKKLLLLQSNKSFRHCNTFIRRASFIEISDLVISYSLKEAKLTSKSLISMWLAQKLWKRLLYLAVVSMDRSTVLLKYSLMNTLRKLMFGVLVSSSISCLLDHFHLMAKTMKKLLLQLKKVRLNTIILNSGNTSLNRLAIWSLCCYKLIPKNVHQQARHQIIHGSNQQIKVI